MHYTGTLYRNPYVAPSPLLEITQGCSHNSCKFCIMYKDVQFRPSPEDWIEQDLAEIASVWPDAKTIQLVGADPFCLSFDRLERIAKLVHKYLPEVGVMYTNARVSNIRNKSVEQLKELRDLGYTEVFIGTESGDDWTLNRVNKGYTSADIIEQSHKLDEAGIAYWHTFLNGVAGRSHSREHALNSAKVFNQTNPKVIGTGGLTLFPGVELGQEARAGKFDPLTDREMMEELYLFLSNLEVGEQLITHHTNAAQLTGRFIDINPQVLATLRREIDHLDDRRAARTRRMKMTL